MLRVAPVQVASTPFDAVGFTVGAEGGVYVKVRSPSFGIWASTCWAWELSRVWPLMARSIVQLALPLTWSALAMVCAEAVKPRMKNWLVGTPGMAKPLPWFSTTETRAPASSRVTDDLDERLDPSSSPLLGFSVTA